MRRVVATFGGVLVLAMLAGGLSEATMALGHRGSLANDILLRPRNTVLQKDAKITNTKSSPMPTISPLVSPKPSIAPPPTQTPMPVAPTATTNSFVHLRSGKSTSSAIITDLNGGTVVELLTDTDAQWQQVSYNGQSGYIFKTYLSY